jgi:uncharacterized repeat protein (TIGR03809 family)
MTYRSDVTRGRNVVARWCALAERRLEYLTELFETGRWRRFHSEVAFLENIREAKSAVETWRDLLTREAALDNSAVGMSWLGHSSVAARPGSQTTHDRPRRLSPAPIRQPSPQPIVMMSAQTERVSSDEAPSVPTMEPPAVGGVAELLPDIDPIERRYPLLHNAL